MSKKDVKVGEDESPVKQIVIEDPRIISLMLQERANFVNAAEEERKKDFQPKARQPIAFRLSPDGFHAYQEWAKAVDQANVGVAVHKVYDPKTGEEQPEKQKDYADGHTKLHEIFAGLKVMEDNRLIGDAVVVVGTTITPKAKEYVFHTE